MTYRHTIILGSLALILAFALPHGALADLKCPAGVDGNEVEKSWIGLQLGIPGVTVTCTDTTTRVTRDYVKDMGQYIGGLYKYFVGVIGIIGAVMVFYGGLRWLTAAGNASHVKDAKEIIFASLIAILIAFGSYTLLYTINPKLVVINPPVLKLADTFLVSFNEFCPTTKVCLSGTNIGRPCSTDATCSGAGSGACALPLELPSGETVTETKCGVKYTYKKIIGVQANGDTCIGNSCQAGQSCVAGTYSADGEGGFILFSGVLIPKIAFDQQPVTGDKYACVDQVKACENITDNREGVGVGTHDKLCKQYSVPKKGMCGWWDESFYTIKSDRCVWRPILTCEPGYERVGCDACLGAGVSCPTRQTDNDSLLSPWGPFMVTTLLKQLFTFKQSTCTATAAEDVYNLDMTQTGTPRAICCRNIADPTVHVCEAG